MSGSHLWPLLELDCEEGQEWAAYRKAFIETYVRDASGQAPAWTDWHGRVVKFGHANFKHAFTRNPKFREGSGHSDELSLPRARRLLWIKEVLARSAGTIHVYRQQFRENGDQKRRRVYYVVDETYVVIFDEPADPSKPLQFVSAYPTNDRDYKAELKQKNGCLIEERRAPKLAKTSDALAESGKEGEESPSS